ncbi:cyclic nucleotide-binding domain-containing protein [bacterium]|nr:cyclic nucleotide-binding domain-containing protein [bacterium]
MNPIATIISRQQFFAGMDDALIERIAGCAAEKQFDQDEVIFREGESADRFFVILEGQIAVKIHGVQRGDIMIQTLDAGDVLGWSWLVPPYQKQFSAQATLPSRALVFDGAILRRMCEGDHDLGYDMLKRFIRVIAARLQATRLQLIDVYASEK